MKHSSPIQLYIESKNVLPGNCYSSEKDNRHFSLPGSAGTVNALQLPILANAFSGNNAVSKIMEPGLTIFRAFKADTVVYESPVKKIKVPKTALRSSFETYLKEIGARLSDIEMALECYDLSGLQFSTRVLKELFHDMKTPVLYRLAVHMDEMVNDNEIDGVKDIFREIKKTIGAEVQKRNRV
jgi:hypothetical protein